MQVLNEIPLSKSSEISVAIVSNRLSNNLHYALNPKLSQSDGGVIGILDEILTKLGGVWVARGEIIDNTKSKIQEFKKFQYKIKTVDITKALSLSYYEGFANQTLWPLCHEFYDECITSYSDWKAFNVVNKKFSQVTFEESSSVDFVWIHDFHLVMVPWYIKRMHNALPVSLFWHIPFPPPELLRKIPWFEDILKSMICCNIICFHTTEYLSNFIKCICQLEDYGVSIIDNVIESRFGRTKAFTLPVQINFNEFDRLAKRNENIKFSKKLREKYNSENIVISVDRLDYTKGILDRICTVELFFELHEELKGKVVFLQIIPPSRTTLEKYKNLQKRIEEEVDRVNRKISTKKWSPIVLKSKNLGKQELVQHYFSADILLVTSIKDGLNLVVKEYAASKSDCSGAIILSKHAGVAKEFQDEAYLIDPQDHYQVCSTVFNVLKKNSTTKKIRMAIVRDKIKRFDLDWWIKKQIMLINQPKDLI